MEDLASLLDSLDVGVADVVVDDVAGGRVRPRNAAMRSVLRMLAAPAGGVVSAGDELPAGDDVPFATLGLDTDECTQLERGAAVEVARGANVWSLRRRGRWLLASDVTALRHAESLVLAGARAGALARVAGTFVHDLNNHLNLGLALFAQLRTMTQDEAERQVCDALAGGAQLAAQLARTLARLLQREAGGCEVIAAGPAMGEALASIAKLCAQREIAVTSRVDGAVRVRASLTELAGLYVQLLLALAELRPRRLQVVLDQALLPIAGGRPRSCARTVVTLHGLAAEGRKALVAAALSPQGTLRDLVVAGHHGQTLPQVVLLAFRLGGEFLVADVGDAVDVTCSLPAVAPSRA